uniref:Putative secreted protein n=1 Tax=Anopheles darlingi TaxID=43151 RepID=A0A2M4DKP9_ANODA
MCTIVIKLLLSLALLLSFACNFTKNIQPFSSSSFSSFSSFSSLRTSLRQCETVSPSSRIVLAVFRKILLFTPSLLPPLYGVPYVFPVRLLPHSSTALRHTHGHTHTFLHYHHPPSLV